MTDRKLFARSGRNEPNEDLEKGAGGAGAPQRFRGNWPTESGDLDETGSIGPRPPRSPGGHLPPFPPPPLFPPLDPFNFDRPPLIELGRSTEYDRPENVQHHQFPLADIREESLPIYNSSDSDYSTPREVIPDRDKYKETDEDSDVRDTEHIQQEATTRPKKRRSLRARKSRSRSTSSGQAKLRPGGNGKEREREEGEWEKAVEHGRKRNGHARDRSRDHVFPEHIRSRAPSPDSRRPHSSKRHLDPVVIVAKERPPRHRSDSVWDSRGDGSIASGFTPAPKVRTRDRSDTVWDSRSDGGIASGFTPAFKDRGLGLPLPRGSFEGPPKHYLPTHAWESAQMLERIAQLEMALEANRRPFPVQHTETPAPEEHPKKGKRRLSFFLRRATIS
jgi:hypothetical protein